MQRESAVHLGRLCNSDRKLAFAFQGDRLMGFNCPNGHYVDSLPQDELCPECWEPLEPSSPTSSGEIAAASRPTFTRTIGLCVIACDVSGSMDDAPLGMSGLSKLQLACTLRDPNVRGAPRAIRRSWRVPLWLSPVLGRTRVSPPRVGDVSRANQGHLVAPGKGVWQKERFRNATRVGAGYFAWSSTGVSYEAVRGLCGRAVAIRSALT